MKIDTTRKPNTPNKTNAPPATTDWDIVHHAAENKFYRRKGQVWGLTTLDDIARVLTVRGGIRSEDLPKVLLDIQDNYQITHAANVAGCAAGVHIDKEGHRYLVFQSHRMPEGVKGEFPLHTEIINSMFDEVQAPYVWGYLQQAYLSYKHHLLTPSWLFVMVGAVDVGKSMFIEAIVAPLLGSQPVKCQKFLEGSTEFNSDLIGSCVWTLSDALSKLDYSDRKTLTENVKDALVSPYQRLRGMYSSHCEHACG
jgi:hypothetical protein